MKLERYEAQEPRSGTMSHSRLSVVAMFFMASLLLQTLAAQTTSEPAIGAPAPMFTVPQPGMAVFSSDGDNVGTVESANGTQDGRITVVNVIAGRFLGLGGRLVAISEGRFL